MKTRKPITLSILGISQEKFTIPAGTRCDPAHNLPLKNGEKRYWCRGWRGMTAHAKNVKTSIGIMLTRAEILNGN